MTTTECIVTPRDPKELITALLLLDTIETDKGLVEERQVALLISWIMDRGSDDVGSLWGTLKGVHPTTSLAESDGPALVGELMRQLDPASLTMAAALTPLAFTSTWTVHIPNRAEYRERLVAYIRRTCPNDEEGLMEGL